MPAVAQGQRFEQFRVQTLVVQYCGKGMLLALVSAVKRLRAAVWPKGDLVGWDWPHAELLLLHLGWVAQILAGGPQFPAAGFVRPLAPKYNKM